MVVCRIDGGMISRLLCAMRMVFVTIVACGGLVFAAHNNDGSAARMSAVPKIDIRSGRIAKHVIKICNHDTVGSKYMSKIVSIVANDLCISGLFKNCRDIMSESEIDFKFDVFLVYEDADSIAVSVAVYDVKRDNILLVKAELSAPKTQIKDLSHEISNVVYKKITNQDAFFNTKIVYVEDDINRNARNARSSIAIRNKNDKPHCNRLAQIDFDGSNHSYILAKNNGIIVTPRYSNDNRTIAYVGFNRDAKNNMSKVFNVYLYDIKSDSSKMLVDSKVMKELSRFMKGKVPEMTYAPRFSPDNNSVVFSMAVDGTSAIYSYEYNKKKLAILTKHRFRQNRSIDTSPCYSSNGEKIIYTSDVDGVEQIFVMNKDGSNVRRLSSGFGKYSQPVWSPRGDLIAYTKQIYNQFYICVMDVNGANEKELVSGYLVEEPCFSPNGRYIAFTYVPSPSAKSRIAIIDITGNHMMVLNTPANKSCHSPTWSFPKANNVSIKVIK